MNQFAQGQTVRITANFKDFTGAQVDPDTVTFRFRSEADGTIVEEIWDAGSSSSDSGTDIVRVSSGIYYLDIDTSTIGGIWDWRIESTVPVNASQGSFYVTPALVEESSSS